MTSDVPNEAHLSLIQSVIARLSDRSTAVKSWCITVTGALLGFGATTSRPLVAFIPIYVILAFAVLDAYYLAVERGYRRLYRDAVAGRGDEWSMAVVPPSVGDVLRAVRSPSIAILYGASLVAVAATATYLVLRVK
jgi:hypothetical protein